MSVKVYWRGAPSVGNAVVEAQIRAEIDAAMNAVRTRGDDFIVNDALWYWQNPSGKVMPCVANAAGFITKTFQDYLESQHGWTKEKLLSGQKIDAYKEFPGHFDLFSLHTGRFLELLTAYERHHGKSSGPVATSVHVRHCVNAAPALSDDLLPLADFFHAYRKAMTLRVAVEFETGNISSSFRAANKLDYLYRQGLVDLGVFITSNDKPNCASRIWPVSNRNGSFQELERRGFFSGMAVPLWQVGFAPDGFDQGTGYLAENGTLYTMQPTDQIRVISGVTYEVWRDAKGQERLRQTPGSC